MRIKGFSFGTFNNLHDANRAAEETWRERAKDPNTWNARMLARDKADRENAARERDARERDARDARLRWSKGGIYAKDRSGGGGGGIGKGEGASSGRGGGGGGGGGDGEGAAGLAAFSAPSGGEGGGEGADAQQVSSSSSSSSTSTTKNTRTTTMSFEEGPLGLTLSNSDDMEQVRFIEVESFPSQLLCSTCSPGVLCLKSVRSFTMLPLSAPSLRSLAPPPRSASLLTPPLLLVRPALYTLDAFLPRSPRSLRHAQGDLRYMSSHGLRVCVSSDTSLSPVVVEEVAAGGQAAALGVQRGDHISTIEGSTAFTDVDSMIELVKAQTRPVKVSIIA